uniref:G_PROTEIN_RECEP_F1_2 domain-containing protein n=1 Tax=Steinernema glaseri TaxID=37863 RepID=A0A1I7YE36_9BILA
MCLRPGTHDGPPAAAGVEVLCTSVCFSRVYPIPESLLHTTMFTPMFIVSLFYALHSQHGCHNHWFLSCFFAIINDVSLITYVLNAAVSCGGECYLLFSFIEQVRSSFVANKDRVNHLEVIQTYLNGIALHRPVRLLVSQCAERERRAVEPFAIATNKSLPFSGGSKPQTTICPSTTPTDCK